MLFVIVVANNAPKKYFANISEGKMRRRENIVLAALLVFVGILHAARVNHHDNGKLDLPKYTDIRLSHAVIPTEYPLYKQCSPLWGQDLMGGNDTNYDTVCDQGCAMSSLSMALHGKGFKLPDGQNINPGTLNHWLRVNGYYLNEGGDPNNLNLTAPELIDPPYIQFLGENEKPDVATMIQYSNQMNPVMIAHVRDNGHFVLVVGYDSQNHTIFHVNDPFYSTGIYLYEDISDLILYFLANVTKIGH